jgi:two-component system, LuxR family, response regulator FixJ
MRPLICIVDDDAAVRESLTLMLETRGYAVEAFGDGAALFARGGFDGISCIVLDVNLPGENGLRLLARIRAATIATPVIVVSGEASDGMRHEARRLDVRAVFDKPVPGSDLLASIAALARPRA